MTVMRMGQTMMHEHRGRHHDGHENGIGTMMGMSTGADIMTVMRMRTGTMMVTSTGADIMTVMRMRTGTMMVTSTGATS